jgi:tetratricopeptide (TPR) repeat protein
MKRSEWMLKFKHGKLGGLLAAVVFAGVAMLSPARSLAQAAGPAPATVQGHVQNAAGQAVSKGDVKFTTDKSGDAKTRKYPFSFPLDANGNFKGMGLPPGDYLGVVYVNDTSIDFIDSVKVAAGEEKTVDFDMTRKEDIDKMTPDERKQLDDFKKQNAAAVAANSKIANLNNLLIQARADTKAGNYDKAVAAMKQATTDKPDEPILWVALGDAELGSADGAAKAAKAAGKPQDADINKQYSDAADAYKKSIELNAAAKKPNPDAAAAAYNNMGQAYAKMGNTADASTAYEGAAKALPAQASMYYYNEAATMYNAGKMDEANAAADKAIAADPKRAEAYYIKGQSLIGKATVDPKTNKFVTPPGCLEAYQTYLQLAPDGPHAEDVKGVLQGMGQTVQSIYKAPPASKKK